jgi:hypothetical protein
MLKEFLSLNTGGDLGGVVPESSGENGMPGVRGSEKGDSIVYSENNDTKPLVKITFAIRKIEVDVDGKIEKVEIKEINNIEKINGDQDLNPSEITEVACQCFSIDLACLSYSMLTEVIEEDPDQIVKKRGNLFLDKTEALISHLKEKKRKTETDIIYETVVRELIVNEVIIQRVALGRNEISIKVAEELIRQRDSFFDGLDAFSLIEIFSKIDNKADWLVEERYQADDFNMDEIKNKIIYLFSEKIKNSDSSFLDGLDVCSLVEIYTKIDEKSKWFDKAECQGGCLSVDEIKNKIIYLFSEKIKNSDNSILNRLDVNTLLEIYNKVDRKSKWFKEEKYQD